MSTESIRISSELLKKVRRKAQKNKQSIITYVNTAIEEKLKGDKEIEKALATINYRNKMS